jgi:putative oxidoreductase
MDPNTTRRPWIDAGLLVARLGLGASYAIFHGWGKISGGPDMWTQVGGGMSVIGVTFAPTFWGFCAAFAEFFGAILLAIGLLFRPAAFLLAFTMFVASMVHIFQMGEGYHHAVDMTIVFTALLITGPGRFAARQWISPLRDSLLG